MGKPQAITAKKKIGDEERSATITYDFGDDLKEMTEKFGEQVVYTNAKGSMVITAQSGMRRLLEKGTPESEIQAKMAMWRPGVAMERTVDVVGSFITQWGDKSPEERQEILKRLKAAEAK